MSEVITNYMLVLWPLFSGVNYQLMKRITGEARLFDCDTPAPLFFVFGGALSYPIAALWLLGSGMGCAAVWVADQLSEEARIERRIEDKRRKRERLEELREEDARLDEEIRRLENDHA